MKYVLLAILPYFIYSVSYYVDKFLLTKSNVNGSVGNLMIGSTLISGSILFPIFFGLTNFKLVLNLETISLVLSMAVIMITSLFFYYKAMEVLRSSVVAILFLLVPVFSFVWAYFLGETFCFYKILGALLIIISAIFLSFESSFELKFKATMLMVLSSFGWSIFYLLFSKLSAKVGFLGATALYQMSLVFIGLFLLTNSKIRTNFFSLFRTKPSFLIVNAIVKVSDTMAIVMINYSMTFIPVALASTLVGIEPAITLIIGLIGAKTLPKYFDDNFEKQEIIKLIIAIILSTVGIILMFAI